LGEYFAEVGVSVDLLVRCLGSQAWQWPFREYSWVVVDDFRPDPKNLLLRLGAVTAADIVLIAQQCLRLGNWELARELCAAGLLQVENDPALRITRAMVELGAGNITEAEQMLWRVRHDNPDHLIAAYTAAWMNIERGQLATAIDDLLEVVQAFPDYPAALGTLATVLMPGPSYREVLAFIHQALRPATYLEIGVETGATLRLAQRCRLAIGVDPDLTSLRQDDAIRHAQLRKCTSDEFFGIQTLASAFDEQPLDLIFIDGMHQFEFVLRDFCNAERWAHSNTTVILHDVLPIIPLVAERERQTKFWVGDAWKTLWLLLELRPDLRIRIIPTPPSGLAIIRGLNVANTPEESRWNAGIHRYLELPYPNEKPGHWPKHLPLVANSRIGWSQALDALEAPP